MPSLKFGFPKIFKDSGFFWTNYFEKDQIKKIINKNLKINITNWRKKNLNKFYDLMPYDYKNKIYKQELAKLW